MFYNVVNCINDHRICLFPFLFIYFTIKSPEMLKLEVNWWLWSWKRIYKPVEVTLRNILLRENTCFVWTRLPTPSSLLNQSLDLPGTFQFLLFISNLIQEPNCVFFIKIPLNKRFFKTLTIKFPLFHLTNYKWQFTAFIDKNYKTGIEDVLLCWICVNMLYAGWLTICDALRSLNKKNILTNVTYVTFCLKFSNKTSLHRYSIYGSI